MRRVSSDQSAPDTTSVSRESSPVTQATRFKMLFI